MTTRVVERDPLPGDDATDPQAWQGRVVNAVCALPRIGGRLLERVELVMDGSSTAISGPGTQIRRVLGVGAVAAATVMSAKAFMDGAAPGPAHVVILILAVTLLSNRFGSFLRDWCPVAILFAAYGAAFGLVHGLSLDVWYSPQIWADKVIGLGELPTMRLQGWFDAGHNHPLAVISALGYLSHFIIPPIFGFYLWWTRRAQGFREYMYSLIAVNLLASVPWVLTPTAPPWLAAKDGLISAPVDVIRMGLQDLGFTQLVAFKDSNTYLIAAALPSIHASWPFLGMLVARKHRLPATMVTAVAIQLAIVWFVIVYTGEHYVIDIAFGVLFSLAAWRLAQWFVRRGTANAPQMLEPARRVCEPQPLAGASGR